MIFTTPMSYLVAAVLKEHADDVAAVLLRLGALHFVDVRDFDPQTGEQLQSTDLTGERATVADAQKRIESIIRTAGLDLPSPQPLDPSEAASVDPNSVNRELDSLVRDVEAARNRQSELQQDINRLEEVARQLPLLKSGAFQLSASQGRFLAVRLGTVPSANFDRLQGGLSRYPAVMTRIGTRSDEVIVVIVSMRRHDSEIESLLREAGFAEQESPLLDAGAQTESVDSVSEKIVELQAQQEEQRQQISEMVRAKLPELSSHWQRLRVKELLLTIRSNFSGTAHAKLFTGWVPKSKRAALESAVRETTGGKCYLEWHNAAEVAVPGGPAVPSELNNPRFLRPFQMLVTNFGTPEYGSVDPTPLVAVAFLAMFGLMFGDAGHGLVLVLLGLFASRFLRSRLSPTMIQLSRLVVWCGGASILTGVLFGAYFGMELLPPLWFDYHGIVAGHGGVGVFNSIFDILSLTIYFGVTVIGVGLLLNWINLARKRSWIPLIFEKTGVLGGIIYATGVWAAAFFASSGFRELPPGRPLLFGLVLPAVLLFAKFPLEALSSPQHGGIRVGWWLMEWLIELLEVFSGYLANTLSFMRVAGLGIAHVTLMIAFFQIAEMAAPNGHNVVSVAILVLGNVLVIGLEGLSAGIQSLRLNYYEFFSKYFSASGTQYKPVSLDASQTRSR